MNVIRNNMILPDSGRVPVNNTHSPSNQSGQTSFEDLLNQRLTDGREIQFSKHASMRLNARDIQISSDQMKRIEDGVTRAYEKGIRDSLVLVDNVALVVNVRNKVVITAMQNGTENVFTNIDGAVIV